MLPVRLKHLVEMMPTKKSIGTNWKATIVSSGCDASSKVPPSNRGVYCIASNTMKPALSKVPFCIAERCDLNPCRPSDMTPKKTVNSGK